MKTTIKIIFGIVFSIVILAILLILYMNSTDDPRGVLDIKPSPDNQYVAYSYYDSGGGAAGYCSFSIALIKLGGNIGLFKANAGQTEVLTINGCETGFKYNWNSQEKNELNIECPNLKYKYDYKKLDSFKGIRISYMNC